MPYINLTGKTVVRASQNYGNARLTFDDGTVAWISHDDILPQFERVPGAVRAATTKSHRDVALEALRSIVEDGHPAERIAAAQALLPWAGEF